jgi:hypothetical protein
VDNPWAADAYLSRVQRLEPEDYRHRAQHVVAIQMYSQLAKPHLVLRLH